VPLFPGRFLDTEWFPAALFTRPKAIESTSVLLFGATIKNQFIHQKIVILKKIRFRYFFSLFRLMSYSFPYVITVISRNHLTRGEYGQSGSIATSEIVLRVQNTLAGLHSSNIGCVRISPIFRKSYLKSKATCGATLRYYLQYRAGPSPPRVFVVRAVAFLVS
jgi:hypothetical protein